MPIAWMNRPSALRSSSSVMSSHTATAISAATGTPAKKPLPMTKYGG